MRVIKPGVLMIGAGLLVGCGSEEGSQEAAIRLASVLVETIPAGSDQLVTTEYRRYAHLSGVDGASMISYHAPGADLLWGTADDTPGFHVECEYGAQTGEKPLDLEVEMALPMLFQAMDSSTTGSILLSILGGMPTPTLHGERYCVPGYKGQSSMDEKVYATGVDGRPSTGDDVLQVWLRWSRNDADGQKSTLNWLGLPASNPAATGPSPQTRFYYPATASGVFRYLISTDTNTYYKYEYDAEGRIKSRQALTYQGEAKNWPGEQGSDVPGNRLVFGYAGDDVNVCAESPSGVALSHRAMTLSGGLLQQRREYAKGPDDLMCTADDVIIRRENYHWRQ